MRSDTRLRLRIDVLIGPARESLDGISSSNGLN
jgi:hypothetical protein